MQTSVLRLATSFLLAACAACAGDKQPAQRNVVLICLDTVRADHLGCYGYKERVTTPNLDRLAARAVLFEHASATAGWTKPSVPSFMTGTYPMQHGVYLGSSRDEAGTSSDVLPEQAETIAESFQKQGYQTAAFVKNAQLRKGLGFEQGFELYHDEAGDAQEIRWKAADWLEERQPERPFFLYLHYLDAHWPYPVPEEFATRFVDPGMVDFLRADRWRELRDAVNDGEESFSPEQLAALIALYDGSIAWLDHQLGLLFKKLEREGLIDNTIVCVISDHGEEFLEHGKLGHGHGLWEGLLHVPWILAIPGRAAERNAEPVSLIDLYPTLLGAAGLKASQAPVGLNRLSEPHTPAAIFAEHLEPGSYQQALTRAEQKTQRFVRFDEASLAQAQSSATPQVQTGTRYEARLELLADGRRRALRLTPSSDSLEDPAELKGVLQSLAQGEFLLAGVRVLFGKDTELYGETTGEAGVPRSLSPGMLVKVRGEALADGRFQAERIKLYAPSDEIEHEVRGVLTSVEDGELIMGGLSVCYDKDTELRGGSSHAKRRFSRADVARFLDLEHSESELAGFRMSSGQRNLATDPSESQPALEALTTLPDLVRFSRAAWRLRYWGAGDRTQLSAQDLQALREIGYAE